MYKLTRRFALSATVIFGGIALLAACSSPAKVGQTAGREYTITIKNALASERFAPILTVGDADESKIWVDKYVSKEARTQFTTGNPDPLAAQLGGDQAVPGKIPVAGELTYQFRTTAKTARITAMVHPDKTPDNYVTAKIDLTKDAGTIDLERFDIGDDEKRFSVVKVGPAGSVSWKVSK